jgi:branched-chain amino acid transport system ATP-binding protein
MLEIENLCAAYGAVEILHNVSLTVSEGETVTVLGANTAGKSTLLRTISRLLPKSTGSIRFLGKELMNMPPQSINAIGISHVPEGRHVFTRMSVVDNLWMGAYCCQKATDLPKRMDGIFELFPRLKERQNQLAGTLSGGEQQMVAIGRALMSAPRLLLLDEPSHGLAPIVVDEVHQAIEKINATGVAVLLVEQNAELALSVSSRGMVLESGRITLRGDATSLRTDSRVVEAYLGV